MYKQELFQCRELHKFRNILDNNYTDKAKKSIIKGNVIAKDSRYMYRYSTLVNVTYMYSVHVPGFTNRDITHLLCLLPNF